MRRSAGLIVASGVLLTAVGVGVRTAAEVIHPFQIGFFRMLFGLVAAIPWLVRARGEAWRPVRPRLHLLRAVFGVTNMGLTFYAFSILPIAVVTAGAYCVPVVAVLVSRLLFSERVSAPRAMRIGVGLVGVLLVIRPFDPTVGAWSLLVVAGMLCGAGTLLTTRRLTTEEDPSKVVAYGNVLMALMAAGPAALVWQTPTPGVLALLLAIGAAGGAANILAARAYAQDPPSRLAPFEFLRVCLGMTVDIVLFAYMVPWPAWIGVALILGSAILERRSAGPVGIPRTDDGPVDRPAESTPAYDPPRRPSGGA